MRKGLPICGCLLAVFMLLLPLGIILSACFGYRFVLLQNSAVAVTTGLLSLVAAVLSHSGDKTAQSGFPGILFSLFMPLSLLNGFFHVLKCRDMWTVVSTLLCVSCCCYLTVRLGTPKAVRSLTFVLSALMVIPMIFLGFLALAFGNMAENTAVRSVESPDGAYRAEIVSSDQGALGGSTFVDVYKTDGIYTPVFQIIPKPERIYRGDWGAHQDLVLFWKDDSCLVIDSVEYKLD